MISMQVLIAADLVILYNICNCESAADGALNYLIKPHLSPEPLPLLLSRAFM